LELKLVDMGGKTEVRYRGPNITPGYWRNAEETKSAFDDEGFFCTGDAVKWIDETDVHLGLKFDGRIAEDFKLATGTFVSVGPLRGKIIAAGAPYIQDVVLTGINLKEVGAMVFPTPAVRALSGLAAETPLADVLGSAPVLAHFQKIINELHDFLRQFEPCDVVVWGAGHQSLTVLSLAQLSTRISHVIDSAHFKQNKYTPGTQLLIKSPESLKTDATKVVLIMAAAYSDEVANQVKKDYPQIQHIAILRETGLEVLTHG
jgi:non-ribosomal peptide synthetase component E (peptide arylation enzyme)